MCVFDDLPSDVSCTAIGCEVSVDESTMYIKQVSLNRDIHRTRLCIDQWMKML